MAEPLDLDRLRSWIGRTETATDLLDARLAESFVATVDALDGASAHGVDPLLGVHWCLAPPIAPITQTGRDGHAKRGGFLPPVPLPRRMWAGGSLAIEGRFETGDEVERRSTVRDVQAKRGRTGALVFVTVAHDYATPRGVAVRERQDLVYRDDDGPAGAPPEIEDPPQARTSRHEATPLLLFRYSALTFNGHRIHYDQPYATGVEGYAGLVVHGPLTATLLLRASVAAAGAAACRAFAFRGRAPLIAGPFSLAVGPRGDAVEGVARAADGGAVMTSRAGSQGDLA
jgi:3-methylfumaryl-CoA hydratase